MDASQIIAAFGGPTKAAAILGSSRTAVSNWRRDGIPARLWFTVLEKAREHGIEGVTQETVAWRPRRERSVA